DQEMTFGEERVRVGKPKVGVCRPADEKHFVAGEGEFSPFMGAFGHGEGDTHGSGKPEKMPRGIVSGELLRPRGWPGRGQFEDHAKANEARTLWQFPPTEGRAADVCWA